MDESEKFLLRNRIRKRRKTRNTPHNKKQTIETISEDESQSDDIVGVNDSDCSDTQLQSAMLGHLHPGDGSFTISDSHLIDLLSGAENDGSYSSPLSNKSEKNMADFEDEESPCEEELAQLAASSHCIALAAAAAASATPRQRPISISDHFKNTATKSSERGGSVSSTNKSSGEKDSVHQLPYRMTEVCQPGNTLLWDLLMDDKIVSV